MGVWVLVVLGDRRVCEALGLTGPGTDFRPSQLMHSRSNRSSLPPIVAKRVVQGAIFDRPVGVKKKNATLIRASQDALCGSPG
jgi:hypothetical protein